MALREVKIADGVYILQNGKQNAMVQFSNGTEVDTVFGDKTYSNSSSEIAKWGANNLLPQDMLKLVAENHIKPQLIKTARDFNIGNGIGIFEKQIIDNEEKLIPVSNPEIEDWMEANDINDYIRRSAYNLEYFANTFTLFDLSLYKKVETIEALDCTDIRAVKIPEGKRKIEKYIYHPDWSKYKKGEGTVLPAYDKSDPTKYSFFLFQGRDQTPGQTYYDWASWWGTKTWAEVSNLIPRFHKSGLNNSYNLKWQIRIPQSYFNSFGPDKEKMEKAEEEFRRSMNEFLAGVDNNNKAMVTKFVTDMAGKPVPGIEIIALDNKMNSDAYKEVNNQANIAHSSGHGIDPSLAGIDTGGRLGGSGSEKRISYQLHIALRTSTPRQILMSPLYVAKKINGWPREIIFWPKDINITTLAEDEKGQKESNTQSNQTY
jgi:hypothetical protein